MAYNGYQPMGLYYPQQGQGQAQGQAQVQQPPPMQNARLWVWSYDEMMRFPLAPNTAQDFWHRIEPIIYTKKCDLTGRIDVEILDYRKRVNAPSECIEAQGVVYATQTDLNGVQKAVADMKSQLDEIRLKIDSGACEGVSEK